VAARRRRSLRRAIVWSALGLLVLLGVYFYFAYSRGVTPLRLDR